MTYPGSTSRPGMSPALDGSRLRGGSCPGGWARRTEDICCWSRVVGEAFPRLLLALVVAGVVLLAALPAEAAKGKEILPLGKDAGKGVEILPVGKDAGPQEQLEGQGWEAFANWRIVLDIVVALVLAAILATVIAYHPRTYGKAGTLEELDQPKIFIMYAVVGAIIAETVYAFPIMGVVIFGIGGLLRFRTDVGPARDTGRVILVTIVGLACGLKIYVAAVIATVFGWILIFLLESQANHRIVVKGLEQKLLAESAEAYEEVLRENGLTVMSEKKNFLKGQVAFVFRAPGKLDREELEGLFKDIPPKLQGAVDWESN